jgi:hypothetical protein
MKGGHEGGTTMRSTSRFCLLVWLSVAWPAIAADNPLVAELRPGNVPDEAGDVGAEKDRPQTKADAYARSR